MRPVKQILEAVVECLSIGAGGLPAFTTPKELAVALDEAKSLLTPGPDDVGASAPADS